LKFKRFKKLKINGQQQPELDSEHPHDGSEFVSIPLRIPAAQPTPDRTVIA
jgi:hypothetical protein